MLNTKSLLEIASFVLMLAAAAILLHDLYRLYQQSELIINDQPRPAAVALRSRAAGGLTLLALIALTWGML